MMAYQADSALQPDIRGTGADDREVRAASSGSPPPANPDHSVIWPLERDYVRYSDRPVPLGTRLFGLGGTSAICALVLGVALFTWHTRYAPQPSATLSVFNVAPPAAPPEPKSEIPPGPKQEQKEKPQPKVDAPRVPPPLVPVPSANAMSVPVASPVTDPGPPVERTTAPESKPAPPAPQASDARPTWQGLVLAALDKVKRYPLEAHRNRQQGTPWIRFVMDRNGRVRSVRLERSSGFDALDREALALPMRASPLPKPPDSVPGDRIELVVPVEFFMS